MAGVKQRSEEDGLRLALLGRLTLAGGLAFWATTFVTSLLPIAGQLRAGTSVPYAAVLVGSLIAGLLLGLCVSYFLIRHFARIPGRNSTLKSAVLGMVALFIVEPVVTLLRSNEAPYYLLVAAALDVPRFLLLGVAIGYFHARYRPTP